jgi:outer membrane protein
VKKGIVLTFFLLANLGLFAQSTLKIGFVDSGVILEQYAPAIKAQSDLDALITMWNTKIDSMTTDLQTTYQEYQQQEATMTPENLRNAQQNLVVREQAINEFRQQKFGQPNGEIFIKREELLQPIKEKILAAIDVVRKEEGMQFVFDKIGDAILLFGDAQYDITFKVLDKLKRG